MNAVHIVWISSHVITRAGLVRAGVRTDGSARGVRQVKCAVYWSAWNYNSLWINDVMKSVTILKYPFTTVFFYSKNSLLYLLFLTMLKFTVQCNLDNVYLSNIFWRKKTKQYVWMKLSCAFYILLADCMK